MARGAQLSSDIFERAIEHLDDGIALVDRSGTIRHANGRLAAIFGYEPVDLVGQVVEMLVPPDVIDDHVAAREHFVHDGASRPMAAPGYDIEGLHRDGRRIPVDVQLTPMTADLLLVVVRDATDARTKAADLALARADLASSRRREAERSATLDVVVQHVFGAAAQLDAVRHALPASIADELDRCVAALHHALDVAATTSRGHTERYRLATQSGAD